mmetsp:Transcript_46714/g.99124  ORF Transcript_46714/g.99124 Transcript_46714/m.99124 type:complete len:292 (+) Transcript_46714:2831-3706(+)
MSRLLPIVDTRFFPKVGIKRVIGQTSLLPLGKEVELAALVLAGLHHARPHPPRHVAVVAALRRRPLVAIVRVEEVILLGVFVYPQIAAIVLWLCWRCFSNGHCDLIPDLARLLWPFSWFRRGPRGRRSRLSLRHGLLRLSGRPRRGLRGIQVSDAIFKMILEVIHATVLSATKNVRDPTGHGTLRDAGAAVRVPLALFRWVHRFCHTVGVERVVGVTACIDGYIHLGDLDEMLPLKSVVHALPGSRVGVPSPLRRRVRRLARRFLHRQSVRLATRPRAVQPVVRRVQQWGG